MDVRANDGEISGGIRCNYNNNKLIFVVTRIVEIAMVTMEVAAGMYIGRSKVWC